MIKHATIKDLAQALGISKSTVSRALADHSDVKPETKRLVLEMAEKMNYRPNPYAQNLIRRRSKVIGVVVPEFVNSFFPRIIIQIQKVFEKEGFNVLISQSGESAEIELKNLHLLENSSRSVICRETAQFDRVYDTARRCCRETLLVGMDRDDCDLTVRQVEKLEHGFRFAVQERGSQTLHHYHLAMDGDFNIENALAAIGVGRLLGAGHDRMAAALDSLVVPGRMNRYEGGGVHVLVDCMHNRASSQALLTDLKRDYPGAPITVVTGIAGGRSPQRIQGMGEMCGKYADRIFFTTDNPDFDDPGDIASRLAHAAAQGGPARVTIQLDRTRAVEQAILEAPAGAVIVLAGKGNDAIQRVRGGYVHYDSDPVVAKRALALREKKQ